MSVPEKVRPIIFGFYASDVCGNHEYVDDITVDEALKRLKSVIDESSVDDALNEDYHRLLWSMTGELDVDKQYLLLSKWFKGMG